MDTVNKKPQLTIATFLTHQHGLGEFKGRKSPKDYHHICISNCYFNSLPLDSNILLLFYTKSCKETRASSLLDDHDLLSKHEQ